MKVRSITYGKTINIGNYQSVKIEIVIEAEDDEKASTVYKSAKEYIEKREREILTENNIK